jgi:hypothetical protein
VNLGEIPAEKPASNSEYGAPNQRANEVGEEKQSDVHPRNSGRDRNQSPNAGQQLPDGNIAEAISGEPIRGAVDVSGPQQDPFAIALDPLSDAILAERETGVVKRECAKYRAGCTGEDDAEERHLTALCPESGERHYQL